VAWERTGITRFDELYERELIVAGTGQAGDDPLVKLISGVLGVHLRLVTGYAGANEANFAMERGEVDGRCAWSWSSVISTRQHWLDDGDIEVLLQLGFRKHADLPDVPLILDLARTEEERQIMRLVLVRGVLGRPFMGPPGIPTDRAEALQRAFSAMVADPQFLSEAARLRLEITPISGEEIRELVAEAFGRGVGAVRGGKGVIGMATRETSVVQGQDADFIEHLFAASTHDYLMFFTNTGRVYVERVH